MRVRKLKLTVVSVCLVSATIVPASSTWAAGDSNVSSCANESLIGFESYQPDCRADEMVTPPFKGGSQVLTLLQSISADGARIIGTSYGGFAGAENNEQGKATSGAGIYEFRREDSRWVAESLEPSARSVSHSSYLAASSNLHSTLWELIEEPAPPETELLNSSTRYELAVRTGDAGEATRFSVVGPEDSPTELVNRENFRFGGASSDLTHIVYSVEAKNAATWPGDETKSGRSLYEYVGTGNTEPLLVGVQNHGKLKGVTHVNEGAELVGKCGTELGAFGFGASKFNAVSADGKTVFFTVNACSGKPAVKELLARFDEEETIHISEPVRPISAEQGSGPEPQECNAKCESAAAREAVFQGANEAGNKVFFTTRQSLLNGDESGEGSGNDLYEAELSGGALTKLIQVSHDPNAEEGANVLGVSRIAAHGDRVYFVATGVLTGENAEQRLPHSGEPNLYVYDTDTQELAFVATLAAADGQDWQLSDSSRPIETTANGRFAVFISSADLTGSEDTSTVPQLFEYDAIAGRIVRASIGQQTGGGYFCAVTKRVEAGYNCNGNTDEPNSIPAIVTPNYSLNDRPTELSSTLSITADGRVFFRSLNALTPGARQATKNIYEYSHENIFLIAPGEDPTLEFAVFQESFNEHDRLVSTDESGNDLFFGAVGQLVPSDTDSQVDVYDARVGGGVEGEAASSCSGISCTSDPYTTAPLGNAASADVAAEPVPTPSSPAAHTAGVRRKASHRCEKSQRKRHRCRAARRNSANRKSAARGGK